MDTLTERFSAWILRAIATAVMFAGVALLLASMPSFALSSGDSPLLRTIGSTLLQWAAVFLFTGIAAKSLLRTGGRPLPNEQVTIAVGQRPEVGGWLLAMTAALVVVPIVLVVHLQPFLDEWRDVFTLIQSFDMSGDMNMSGIVLIPLAGALTPPFFELTTMVALVGTSAILILLLLLRSHRFPRMYLVCCVLVTALLLASVRGVSTVGVLGDAVRQQIVTTSINAAEAATLNAGLDRYMNAVVSTAPPLAWAWLAYMIWLPAMFRSPRVRTTFGSPVQTPIAKPETPQDVATVTAPPRFPGLFY